MRRRGTELVGDGLRQLRRTVQGEPDVDVDALEARRFRQGGNVGGDRGTLLLRHTQRHDLVGAHLGQSRGQHEHAERELAAHQVGDQRRDAAIGHVFGMGAGGLVDHFTGQVQRGAHARRAEVVGARRLFAQLGQVLCGGGDARGLGGGQQQGLRRDHAQRGEVSGAVVLDCRIDQARDGHFVGRAQQQRVAVGLGARHALRADGAARAAEVLDDDALAQLLRQFFTEQARGQVDAAARGIAHDQRDGMVGVIGGLGGERGERGGGTSDGQHGARQMRDLHEGFPLMVRAARGVSHLL